LPSHAAVGCFGSVAQVHRLSPPCLSAASIAAITRSVIVPPAALNAAAASCTPRVCKNVSLDRKEILSLECCLEWRLTLCRWQSVERGTAASKVHDSKLLVLDARIFRLKQPDDLLRSVPFWIS